MRQALRRYLFAFVRERARAALDARSTSASPRVVAAGTLLDPDALTSASRGASPATSGPS